MEWNRLIIFFVISSLNRVDLYFFWILMFLWKRSDLIKYNSGREKDNLFSNVGCYDWGLGVIEGRNMIGVE